MSSNGSDIMSDQKPDQDTEENLKCSFCDSSQSQVKKMIVGPSVNICNGCIDICQESLSTDVKKETAVTPILKLRPKEVYEFLDKHVIGQERAKQTLSVAVVNHYKRLNKPDSIDVELDKSNILMIGPSGTGKTLLVSSLSKLLNVPFVIVDATSLTENGYVGTDTDAIVARLASKAKYNIPLAENGIIFIDEIDKKRTKNENANSRDISGEGVQQALLKIIEGTDVFVRTDHGNVIKMNTSNILFICSGAFIGLEKVLDQKNNYSVGFGAPLYEHNKSSIKDVTSDDLISYGIIPELVGRLPVVVTLDDLTETQLVSVLHEPKNSIINQFKTLFELDGIKLSFTEKALWVIANETKNKKVGARELRKILENRLQQLQYDLPELSDNGVTSIEIDEQYILQNGPPIFRMDVNNIDKIVNQS